MSAPFNFISMGYFGAESFFDSITIINSMRVLIFICIVLAPIPSLSHVLELQPVGTNIDSERQEISRFLDQLASAPTEAPPVPERANSASDDLSMRAGSSHIGAHGLMALSKSDLEGAGRRSYASNQVLGCMGVLAALAAAMVGTTQQNAQAALLSHYSGLLAGNSDPGLQQASAVMGQESQAVAAGSSADATTLAQSFANIPEHVIPDAYQPSADDLGLASTLQTVETDAFASALAILGRAAMAGLLATMQGGVYGAVVGIAASLVESSIQENFNAQASSVPGIGGALVTIESSLGSSGGQTQFATGPGLLGIAQTAVPSAGAIKNSAVLTAPSGAADHLVQPGNGAADGGALVGSQQIQ